MSTIYPVIMCGGAGTRLWPLSRRATPKQYLPLVGRDTLLEATVARAADAPTSLDVASPTLICGAGQQALAGAQAETAGYPPLAIIVEPAPRNTAAVAATAALHVHSLDPDGVVLLLPADHHMARPEGFWRGVDIGMQAASDGELVTLGIAPAGPETGYGYIRSGAPIADNLFKVDSFKEKPDRATAESYIAEGGYHWNAGIFLFRADAMLREFEALAPDILTASRSALELAYRSGPVVQLDEAAFSAARAEPVDIEIMERTSRAAVVAPVRAGWDDIGSWAALSDLKAALAEAAAETVVDGDAVAIGCSGGMVRSEGPFVAAVGLTDVVVVASGDAVLVIHKDAAQNVKKVVEALKAKNRESLL